MIKIWRHNAQHFLQTVAITEKKQYCGGEEELTTTKICFTYPDASWVCKVCFGIKYLFPLTFHFKYIFWLGAKGELWLCRWWRQASCTWGEIVLKISNLYNSDSRWRCPALSARSKSRLTSASGQGVALSPTTQTAWPPTYPLRWTPDKTFFFITQEIFTGATWRPSLWRMQTGANKAEAWSCPGHFLVKRKCFQK